MSWVHLSLILPFCSTFFSLASKELLKHVEPISYTAYVLLFSGIMVLLYNVATGKKILFSKWAVMSGLAFGLATFGFEKAVNMVANPGIVSAVYRTQTVLTAIASVFLLGSKLSMVAIIGIVLAVAGAITVATDHSSVEHFESGQKKDSKENGNKYGWLPWTAGAGVLLSVKDITAVKAVREGMTPYSYAVSQLLFGALVLFIYKLYKQRTLALHLKPNTSVPRVLGGMMAVSLDNLLWCLLLVYVMGIAPNPAYPKAITLGSVVLTAFLSRFMFSSAQLDAQQWVGILMVLGGVGTMVFSNSFLLN